MRSASGWRSLLPWFAWLALFYGAWASWLTWSGQWGLAAARWPMAVAMAVGSFFAGSTPMGGGTVGFPMLVLLFGQPVALGRDFSLLVQSIGMVSASVFILASRTPVAWGVLRWSLPACLVAMPIGLFVVAPALSPGLVKLVFAVVGCSFGLLHVVRLRDIVGCAERSTRAPWQDRLTGLLVGVVGAGCLASTTGVGTDIVLYLLVLGLARMDVKVAVPTSVIAMAFTSVVGAVTLIATGRMHPDVWGHWYAAAPVVALGAPLGAVAVQVVSRTGTLLVVSLLLIGQFVWTCVDGGIFGWDLILPLAGIALSYALFHAGFALTAREPAAEAVPARVR